MEKLFRVHVSSDCVLRSQHKRNSQLFSCAQSRDQAAVLFQSSPPTWCECRPRLRSYVTIRDTAKELVCAELGTKYKALSGEASTALVFEPVICLFDELGQVRGPRSTLYEAMETATAAQEQPLTLNQRVPGSSPGAPTKFPYKSSGWTGRSGDDGRQKKYKRL